METVSKVEGETKDECTQVHEHIRTLVDNFYEYILCVLCETFRNFISTVARLDYHYYTGKVCNQSENKC